MLKNIAHVGITVSNIEASINFYEHILGLKYIGQMVMEGKETDKLFGIKDCKVKVAYLNGSDTLDAPPVELIQFVSEKASSGMNRLNKISISELCFYVEDIENVYKTLRKKGVKFLSPPQIFDFTTQGFGRSKAVYFKDPDDIILELIESID